MSALTDATINPLGKMQPNKYFALSFLVLFGLLNWIYFARDFSSRIPWWLAHQELSRDRLNQKLLIVLSGCAILMMLTMGWARETARAYNGYLIDGYMTLSDETATYEAQDTFEPDSAGMTSKN